MVDSGRKGRRKAGDGADGGAENALFPMKPPPEAAENGRGMPVLFVEGDR